MPALPSIAEAEKLLPSDSPALSLYATVLLPAERGAIQSTNKRIDLRLIFARVVGYLLLYPPSDQARAILQGEVAHCKDDSDPNQAVYDLGQAYLMGLILPLCKHSAPLSLRPPNHHCLTRPRSATVDRPTLEDATPQSPFIHYGHAACERIQEAALQSEPRRPRNVSEAKGFALIRDGFRCMVSRVGDAFAVHRGIIPLEAQDSPWIHAQCCHIFPAALELGRVRDDGTRTVQMEHAVALWAILERFGYGQIHDELQGADIHRLENVMTLAPGVYSYFWKMDLWLEEDDGQPDWYRVGVSTPLILEGSVPPIPERVRFVARANFPLPSPTYLHIHAACCRIAQLSGAWECLETIFCDGLEAAMDDEGMDECDGGPEA